MHPTLEQMLWFALLGVSGLALLWLTVVGPLLALPTGREVWVIGSGTLAVLLCLCATFVLPSRPFWGIMALGVLSGSLQSL